jgi:hypothetical protein
MGILTELLKPEENVYFGEKITGTIQQVVAGPTAEALREFCRQEPEFKQAMKQSDKTFQACLDGIAQLCDDKDGVSDLDVFRAAVKFYFPTADIRFRMEIDLCAETDAAAKPQKETLSVSLDELLDF